MTKFPHYLHILQPYKQKDVKYFISLCQFIWLHTNHIDVTVKSFPRQWSKSISFLNCGQNWMFYELLRERGRDSSPKTTLLWTIFITGTWWGMSILVGKHKFIIMLRGVGRRPRNASCLENGIFCFWPFLKGSHSLCARVNVLITIVIGAQGGPLIGAVTDDCIAHFFRTTATLIFLPSTKKKEVKDPESSIKLELSTAPLFSSFVMVISRVRYPKPFFKPWYLRDPHLAI